MTFLANIALGYEGRQVLDKNPELKAEVVAKFGEEFVGWSSGCIADAEQCEWLTDRNLPFSIKRFKGMTGGTGNFSERVKHVTQIAVPNVGLLAIDTVLLLEDACTDNLQAHLNDGWRLLAICPPNSQRRPDYILGRMQTD